MADGAFEHTVYTSGFSARTLTYHYADYDNPAIRSVSLADYETSGDKLISVSL